MSQLYHSTYHFLNNCFFSGSFQLCQEYTFDRGVGGRYSEDAVHETLCLIQKGEIGSKKASKLFKIIRSTLNHYLKKDCGVKGKSAKSGSGCGS